MVSVATVRRRSRILDLPQARCAPRWRGSTSSLARSAPNRSTNSSLPAAVAVPASVHARHARDLRLTLGHSAMAEPWLLSSARDPDGRVSHEAARCAVFAQLRLPRPMRVPELRLGEQVDGQRHDLARAGLGQQRRRNRDRPPRPYRVVHQQHRPVETRPVSHAGAGQQVPRPDR